VSAPNKPAAAAVAATAGRLLADGRRIYRLVTALVVWWVWVIFAAASVADLVIQSHDFLSVKFALGLLTVTGLVFACTLWPKVIADDVGLVVRNPLRSFAIPWTAVKAIYLADSVEIQCARGPDKKDKTVYCWALSAARRGRAKARLHGWQIEQGKRDTHASYGKLPSQARELTKMTSTEVIAREMARMSEEATARLSKQAGAGGQDLAAASVNGSSPAGVDGGADSDASGPGAVAWPSSAGTVTGAWAWPALAAILVPGIAFAIVMLAG
jgi:PH (Pleckstrin Homology) domain-containing protein